MNDEIKERLIRLEIEVDRLKNEVYLGPGEIDKIKVNLQNLHDEINYRVRLPETGVVSDRFTTRALAIWGHVMAVQFVFAIAMFCLAVFLSLLTP